jgi:signal transduction histidine kinase
LVVTVCILTLAGAFVIDLLTPQEFVAAILLDVPIVLSSLGGSRRFTFALVVAALVANIVAGYFNGVVDHHHWAPIGIGDRILAGLSIMFVGYLGGAVQDEAQRAGRSEALGQRALREAEMRAALERLRSSLSPELVVRAIAREAADLLGGSTVRLVLPDSTSLVARTGVDNVELDETRPSPAVASLVARTLDAGDVVSVRASDALGRLVLDELGARAALALPLIEGERRFGVAIVLLGGAESDDTLLPLARAFARQAAGALAQARLFEQLADRNEALEERSAVIRDLVYALSHDLRTPLAALAMTMRQAQRGDYGELPTPYRTILEHSIVATDDVARLAETLLLVARFESGEHRSERVPVDLHELAVQIAAEFAATANVAGVALRVEGTAPPLAGDRSDLRRAITNLVANAIAHTPAGGTVTIALGAEPAAVAVRVFDDGYGVEPGARARLFTRFAPGESRRGGGTGLGLYIVGRVAAAAGGTAGYEPNTPRGSIFWMRLPNR